MKEINKIKQSDEAPLCACGCGKQVRWTRNKWNKFIYGHIHNRRLNWKPKPPDSEAPLCACGCNQKVRWNKKGNDWNKYINRHDKRGKNPPNKGKSKYAIEKAKPAPLCACGCEEEVKWATNKWNKFIHGHNRRGKNLIIIYCAQCNKSKEITLSNKRKNNFCNPECHYKWASENMCREKNPHWGGGKITIYCAWCRKSKKICPSNKKEYNFCNHRCWHKWASENICGEKHPLYGIEYSKERKIKISGDNSPGWKGGISNRQKMKEIAKKWHCTAEEAKERIRQTTTMDLTEIIKEKYYENNRSVY